MPCRIFLSFLHVFSAFVFRLFLLRRFFLGFLLPFLQVFFTFTFECYKVDDFYFTFFLRFIDVRDLIGLDGKADISLQGSRIR